MVKELSMTRETMEDKVDIRWMIRRDMSEVLEIEGQCFEFAWTEEDFLCCLRQRNCIGMIAERQERVVGFMVYELLKRQLHVLNFAVDPHVRKQGVGTQMVAKLVHKLAQQRRNEILLEVRERNLVAQLFFRSQHFEAYGVFHGYYEDTDEDAYAMRYQLPADENERAGRIPVNFSCRFGSNPTFNF